MSLMTWEEARELRIGKRLVFTNGVFDILHVGHVALLERARSLGDLVIVGINSDDSVRALGKSPNRPINSAENRAIVLAALRYVDAVVVFEEANPMRVIEFLKPEVHVKGGDYVAEDMPESPVVNGYGGQIVIVPIVEGHSTTRIAKDLGLS